MNWSNRSILGLAIEDSSITVCELRRLTSKHPGHTPIVRGAIFDLHDELSFDQPAELGRVLAKFLSEHRFTERRAAVGLPANWLMVQPNTLPPGDDEETLASMRLMAERAFATEAGELVMDAWLDSGAGEARRTLFAAAHKKKLEAIQTIAEHARLKLVSVSSSLLAIAVVMKDSTARESLLLRVAPTNVSMLHRRDGAIAMLKLLAVAGPVAESSDPDGNWSQRLAGELRRITAFLPTSNGSIGADKIIVWDDAGLPPDRIDRLHEALAIPIEQPDRWISLGMQQQSASGPQTDRSWAVGAAVALAAVRPRTQRVDLLKSRLVQPARPRGRSTRWIALIVVAILIICGVFVADVTRNMRAITRAKKRLTHMTPLAESATQLRDKITFAQRWYDRRPQHIDCLVTLTAAFPETGSVWASNVTIRSDMSAVVTARAVDEPSALAVFDALKASIGVSEVKLAYLRQADRRSQEVSFSVTFQFSGGSDS